MVGEILGGTLLIGATGVLSKLAAKVPKALEDTQLTVLNIGARKAVALPEYGEYTYSNKNQMDSTWWLYYGRDEESGYDGYTLTLKGAKIYEYAGQEGIFANGDLHIRLIGENMIGWGAEKEPACAICFRGNLLITGEGVLKVAATEAAVMTEKGDLISCGQDVQMQGRAAVVIREGKCCLEEGTLAFTGNIEVPELVSHPDLKIVAAKDAENRNVPDPVMGAGGFFSKKQPIYYVKLGNQVEAPVVIPEAGSEVEAGEAIRVESPTWGAEIFYTTNGKDPLKEGMPYQGEIPAYEGILLKLGAKYKGLKDSPVVAADYVIRKHTLSWKLDGEAWGEPALKACGDFIELPEVPEKEGHTFAGWKEVPEAMPAANLTVEGKYVPNRYTFTCQLLDQVYARDTYLYGSKVKTPASPARFGYDFSGWGEIPAVMPARDVVLKGRWNPKKFRFVCLLEGKVYAADMYGYETRVKKPANPAKIGYDFSGWGEIPAVMPAQDVVLEGHFQVHSHKLSYVVDGEAWKSFEVDYGTALTLEAAPEREGYTFSGWSEIPALMPDQDVEVRGQFAVNTYTATWMLNGQVQHEERVQYGELLPVHPVPSAEGHTFAGWENIPARMPAQDLVFVGTLTPNKYALEAFVEGSLYAKDAYLYGSSVKTPASPAKTGYVFSGWGEIPAKMPAHDVVLQGHWERRKFSFCCMLEGKVYAKDSYAYEAKIKTPANPARVGCTFSGWSEIPAVMPAEDVTVSGSFAVNHYKVTYTVDGAEYKTQEMAYGEKIEAIKAPEKEGCTFSGWSEIPAVMPAEDVTVSGSFAVNHYKVTYTVDGAEYKIQEVAYGEKIEAVKAPEKEGHTFSGWSEIPAVMPAEDVTVSGSFAVNHYKISYQLDEETIQEAVWAFGEEVQSPQAPQAEGKVFEGWSEVLPSTMPAQDIVVKALWRILPVNLTIESLVCEKEEAKTGETVAWTTKAVGGDGQYSYRYHVHKDGKKLSSSEFGHEDVFRFQVEEPGVYRVRVYVRDGSGKQVTKISANLMVRKEKGAAPVASNEPLSIQSVQADVSSCHVGEEITWQAHAAGGSGEYVYRYHVLKDGEKLEATEFGEESRYTYVPQEPGVYCVRLFVKNKEKKGKQVTKQSGNVQVSAR